MSADRGHITLDFVQPGEAGPVSMPMRPRPDIGLGVPGELHSGGPGLRPRRRRRGFLRRFFPFALALGAVAAFAVMTEAGRRARSQVPVRTHAAQMLERLGLGLSEITVTGQNMTPDREIYDRLALKDARSIWLLDTAAIRQRVETLPWILKASVKRVFPDRLHIDITERKPAAVWRDGEMRILVDGQGRMLGPAAGDTGAGLPQLFGAGASPNTEALLALMGQSPELAGRVALYEWTAGRRWTLHLKSGQRIYLPARRMAYALAALTDGRTPSRLIDANFDVLDLRLPKQAAITFRE